MNQFIYCFFILSALSQISLLAASPEKLIIIFGNHFEGENAALKIESKLSWEGKLFSSPELGCAKLVIGEITPEPFNLSIKVDRTSVELKNVGFAKGKYIIINYDSARHLIEVKQTATRPRFLIEDP